MKVGIMQPYFIPYIGYWQLISVVDKYVIYDDVNFIKGGWINRNRILVGGEPHFFNIPLIGASSNKKINEILVNHDINLTRKSIRIIEAAYKKAPFYGLVKPIIIKILEYKENNLAKYIGYSIEIICDYLGISTELIYSSTIAKDNSLKGQNKVISICDLLGATEYYNSVGGRKLYSYEDFEKNKIKLKFLEAINVTYKQFDNEFQENLSIIDILMFNPKAKVREMLKEYRIINMKMSR